LITPDFLLWSLEGQVEPAEIGGETCAPDDRPDSGGLRVEDLDSARDRAHLGQVRRIFFDRSHLDTLRSMNLSISALKPSEIRLPQPESDVRPIQNQPPSPGLRRSGRSPLAASRVEARH
jgi:hypothetical protein